MLKTDLHIHTSDDPVDNIPYSTVELIDRAAQLQFGALAVTLHDRQSDTRHLIPYARERGIVLIPGVERTIRGRHVLLLNFPAAAESLGSFDDLARLKAQHPEGLVVAPHPFFPHTNCLRKLTDDYRHLFDAVEVNGFYASALNFNRAAITWAHAQHKPLIGNSDAHRLHMVGRTFSLVDAAPSPDAICSAIKRGLVEVQSTPLSLLETAAYCRALFLGGRRPERAAAPSTAPA